MAERPGQLDVYLGADRVGTLYDVSPMAFEYAPTWLARGAPLPVAAIPCLPGRHDGPAVQAFFENLLPEGELRDYIAARKKASTLFAMLLAVAGDTAGGFVILPAGQVPQPATYTATTWKAIAANLARKSASAIDIQGRDARISLAGAQDKTGITLFADGVPRLPMGTSPSTHILKPDIRRFSKVWNSAANEAIIMLAAARCGLPTAAVFYERHTQACVVRRFDRHVQPDGTIGRWIQYDLCQLSGIVSERKYEKEGGPGIAQCTDLVRRHSTQPAVDLRNFVAWIFFNLFVGNNDSHAKNLALVSLPGQGLRLAPFYDLMCTRIYPGLSAEFAFAVGGETKPGAITSAHVPALARQLGMRPQFIIGVTHDLAQQLPDAMQHAAEEVMPLLSASAKVLADRLGRFVRATTGKMVGRMAG